MPGLPLRRLTQLAADGRSVTVEAMHGDCDDRAVVSVLETGGSVVLSNSVKNPRKGICTDRAQIQRMAVKLERPLGDRLLLDAITGRPLTACNACRPTPERTR
ncbi:hypothetical protein [Streptomyces boninensis]|uniref:hypothetical protein n=1 Tax=Streptomyces boninensis TaxID=2039455 RepID=UPI003B20DA8B